MKKLLHINRPQCRFNSSSLCAVTPLLVYDNPDLQKKDIMKENRGKSGGIPLNELSLR
jgi:hypothetical protein